MKNSLTRSNLQRDSTSDKRSPRGSHVSGSVGCLSAVQETHKSACSRKRVRFARKRAESRLSDHLSYQTVRISWTPRCSRLVGISLLSLNGFYEENQRRGSRQKFRWEIFKFWSETYSGFTSGLIISAGCSSKSPKNSPLMIHQRQKLELHCHKSLHKRAHQTEPLSFNERLSICFRSTLGRLLSRN